MKNKRNWISIAMIVMIAFTFFGAGSSQAVSNSPASIRLNKTTFTPGVGEGPQIPPGLAVSSYAAGQRGYYIVQSDGPVTEAWKARVSAVGGELLDYVPDFAFKVRMNPAQAARVANLDDVTWVGIFQPAYKLSPELDFDSTNLVRVRAERGSDFGQVRAAVAQSGAKVLSHDGEFLLVGADGAQLQSIANVLDVAWVENYVLPEKLNEYGAGVIVGANTANANGYDGSTQTAAVSDTGLGGGTAATAHADIPASRIVSIYNWPGATNVCFQTISDDGSIDVDSGHGTHTAVSVLGDGGVSGEGKGTAPAASLVFQSTENWATISNYCQMVGGWPANGYFLTGLPDDLRTMYQQAYNDGARIHSNSWGSSLAGEYTVDSANTDDFIWDNPDMSITFSAGNAGIDANANGVVDDDSIGSPATAKNVITIGASENARPDNFPCDSGLTYGCDGQNDIFTYNEAWGSDFPANPLANDPSAGNDEQMAAFSSRGPTDDGRIKPDVVAPGTWVLSGYSDLYQEDYDSSPNPQNDTYQYDGWGFPLNSAYKYMGGTSMSNPIAAGAATVVRDFYQKAESHTASAALVKASLINSAVDLLDENNDGADDNAFPIPNMHEGWGRIDVANATDGSAEYADVTPGLSTSGSDSYQFTVASAGSYFKVSLVWSDYPSTEAASSNLVNDLDLVVTAPGGAQYIGNVFSGGWSQTGGSADRVNNVENIYVQSAASGTWTVQVSGYNVPNGPQPYALVVDGSLGDPGPTLTPTPITPTPTSTPVTPTPTSTPVTPTPTPEPGVTMHVGDLDGSSTIVRNKWNASVTITIHDASESPVANATVSGNWSNGASGSDSCDTDGSGQCAITVSGVRSNISSVTFTVDSVTHASNTYDSSVNHDPDGDSDGITIVVYKDGLPEPTSTPEPTPTPGAGVVMHIGDLDGSGDPVRNKWAATVTITVHDASENPITNAVVTGIWSVGGEATCTTDAAGQCSVTKTNLKTDVSAVTFTVNDIAQAGSTYNEVANHDPDGDSDGTTITVLAP